LRGAAAEGEAGSGVTARVVAVDERTRVAQAHDVKPRCEHVGVPLPRCGSGELGRAPVVRTETAVRFERARCEYPRVVRGVGELLDGLTFVPRRRDHD